MKALVIGATGLVGKELVRQLLADPHFTSIHLFVRRTTGMAHPKLQESIIDFNKPDTWKALVKGDVLFSALGTTLKTAGSKEAQYQVDHTYQYAFAKAASENGVPVYVLVSAAMAHPASRLFYSRMKGELERDVKALTFRHIHIFRPGLLAGDRSEKRIGERVGYVLLSALNRIGLARSQRPVHASVLARAMARAAIDESKALQTYTLLEVFRRAGEKF